MHLIAKAIRISHHKLNFIARLTTVQDIQDYSSLIFLGHGVVQYIAGINIQLHTVEVILETIFPANNLSGAY